MASRDNCFLKSSSLELVKSRAYLFIGNLVVCAFITPDASPTTLFALAGPLYFLFELGVVLSYAVTRKRRERAKAEALEEKRLEEERRAARQRPDVQPREPRRLGVNA